MLSRANFKLSRYSLVMTCLLLLVPGTGVAERLVIFTGDVWPPYIIDTPGLENHEGIGIELLREMFARLQGTGFRYQSQAWKRALKAVQAGDLDGIAFLQKTREREEYMDFTKAIFRSYSLLWYRKENFPGGFQWQDISDLEKYRLGKIRGYSYGSMIDTAISEGRLNVIDVSTMKQMFTVLERDRVDLVLANAAVGEMLDQWGMQGIQASPKPLATDVHYISFSKKSPARELIPQLNKLITELTEDGTIKRIILDRQIPVVIR